MDDKETKGKLQFFCFRFVIENPYPKRVLFVMIMLQFFCFRFMVKTMPGQAVDVKASILLF